MISFALSGFDDLSKETEIIPEGKEGIFMNLLFTIVIKIGQDPPVLPEQAMNITDKIV